MIEIITGNSNVRTSPCNSNYVILGLLVASIFGLSLMFNVIAIIRMRIAVQANIAKYCVY